MMVAIFMLHAQTSLSTVIKISIFYWETDIAIKKISKPVIGTKEESHQMVVFLPGS